MKSQRVGLSTSKKFQLKGLLLPHGQNIETTYSAKEVYNNPFPFEIQQKKEP